jgi:hypothetical protein
MQYMYMGWSFNSGTDFFPGKLYHTVKWQQSGTCVNSVQVYVQNRRSVSPRIRSVESFQWTSTCSVSHISQWGGKCSSMCASISVSVWEKPVLKCTKCCKQLSESPAYINWRHLSGIPISKVDADPLKTTPTQAGHPPPTLWRTWPMCKKSFALTNIYQRGCTGS